MRYSNGSTTPPKVSSPFGIRDPSIGISSQHNGADCVGFTKVHAIAAGRVTYAGWMNDAAGYTVVIDHGAGVTSLYMHNKSHTVAKGDRVTEGQQIAVMGMTGNASGPCNHLEIRLQGRSIDPMPYIAARLPGAAAGGSQTPNTPNTTTTTKDDEMTASYINVTGTPGKRRGGCYAIMRSNDGKLFARFVSGTPLAGVPTISGSRELGEWDNTMSGLA